jgi:hypothetical protein
MEEAVEIAKLRLFLAPVTLTHNVDQLEPLHKIGFNNLPGNFLFGLMRVDDAYFEKRQSQLDLFHKSYPDVLLGKNRFVDHVRYKMDHAEDLSALRDNIDRVKPQAQDTLNGILLNEFQKLGIKFEQVTWDTAKNKEGKPTRRTLKMEDIEAPRPCSQVDLGASRQRWMGIAF